MFFRILVTLACLAALPACIESPVSSYNVKPEDKPAATLDEARAAVLNSKARLAADFYFNAHAADLNNPELAFFDAATYLETESGVDKSLEKSVGNLEPNKVLLGLKKAQAGLSSVTDVLTEAYLRLSDGLPVPFQPFVLGQVPGYDKNQVTVYFDRAEMFHFANTLVSTLLPFDIIKSINLDTVEAFDDRLNAIRDSIYKSNPDCNKPQLPQTQQNACANKVLAAGLDLLMTSKDPAIQSVFTMKSPEKIASDFHRFVSLVRVEKKLMEARAPLEPRVARYFGYGSTIDQHMMDCLTGRCQLDLRGASITMDLPGFFAHFPTDLRRLMPRKYAFPENFGDVGNALKDVVLVDPTLGGLFPDGDLLEKAGKSDMATGLFIYFGLMTAWALPQ